MPTKTIPLSALRPIWLALPLLPWLAGFVPWFAPAFTVPWFALAFYFWPANKLAFSLGFTSFDPVTSIFLLGYCLLWAGIVDFAMRTIGKRRGEWKRVRRRSASLAVAALASVVIGVFAFRYTTWIDWPEHPAPVDHPVFALRAHSERIDELVLYQMPGGLFDHNYAGRLRADPGLLPELITSLQLRPVREEDVSDDFWTAPGAYWWQPPASGRFFASRGFSVTERGPDGNLYLFMEVPGDEVLWFWLRANF